VRRGVWVAVALMTLATGSIASTRPDWVIVVHGGAGGLDRAQPLVEEAAMRTALGDALRAGGAVLESGGRALDAVETAVVLLEDSPLFNAGRGAVFTASGTIELDASIMDGDGLRAGAVAGVQRIRNPVRAARAVMDHSRHVFLNGVGAEAFAETQGLERVDPAYFHTDARWRQLEGERERERARESGHRAQTRPDHHGTVGAVALDRGGHLAAATSTGGLTNKRYGRIGDSPVIGAGTYADDRSCAVSATGEGEYFIRLAVARTICAQVEYAGASIDVAARAAIAEVGRLGGEGGVIVVDGAGRVAMVMNTTGMSRGRFEAGGAPPAVKLFAEE
jgi:beta-aspartyl-peptidase (threonine type)